MIPLEKLKAQLTITKTCGFTTAEFLDIHRYMEGYLKRVLFIGLRLKGVQYKNAEFIVSKIQLDIATAIGKSWFFLDQSGSKNGAFIKALESKHPDLFILKEVFITFCSRYRNQVAHGLIGQISGQDAIDLLCHVNLSFYKAIEAMLQAEFSCSAFDTPTLWGASRSLNEGHATTIARLSLGKYLSKAPQRVCDVKTALASTKYPKL